MIKSAIFDLGGVYFTYGIKIVAKKIGDKYNLKPEIVEQLLEPDFKPSALYRKGKITGDEFWDKVKDTLKIKAENKKLAEMWINSYTPIEGTINIIKQLKKKGIKLYFLSDNFKERAEYLQRRYNFLKNFTDGIFSYKVHMIKQDGTKIFELALEKTGEKPENIVYIDDKEKYVETAKKIGMNAICFKNPEQLDQELKNLGL